MAVLLITYDLNKPGQNYNQILDYIKNFSYVPLSESSYAIDTKIEPENIYNDLSKLLDSNDRICIITLTQPWAAYLSPDILDWLKTRL